jgi:hypothetical protein
MKVTAREIAAVAAALLAIAFVATLPLGLHLTTNLPNDLGDPVLNVWILGWDAKAIAGGFKGFWEAPNFFPYHHTLAYSDHLLGIAVFTAPIQWITRNAVLTYNIAYLASFAQAGVGLYLLARLLTGRRDAAFLGALIYAFAPYRVAHMAHLQWLLVGWLPLALWGLHRYVETRAWRAMLIVTVCYLMQALTATYFTYFALIPLGIVAVGEAWRARPALGRTAMHVAGAAVLVAVTLAPIASVYYGVRLENDFKRDPTEIQALSADVADYLRAHNFVWLWRHVPGGTGEHELFPGALTLVLATIALSAARTRSAPAVRIYGAVAAITFFLSLGPYPTAWGHRSSVAGPYQWLLWIVPGLDGLRSVSRLGVVVLLALAVLAAIGATVVLDRLPRRYGRWAVALMALIILGEGWAAPIPNAYFAPTADPDDRRAYEYLRSGVGPGAAIELPMTPPDIPREMRYQYLTLVHGHRIVNGESSYKTRLQQMLDSSELSPLADLAHLDDAVGFLRGIGVRYVIVHREAFQDARVEKALATELEGDARQVVARQSFGRTAVFTLAPDTATPIDAALRPVPPSSFHARASHEPARLPLLFDGDPDTRWLTAGRQTGDEWIELEFEAPRNVAAVRMQTAERSFADYPRELSIEAVEAGGTRTLFRGSVLPEFARGFVDNGAYPTIAIAVPDNHARVLRLRQLGTTDKVFWSIHELQVLERVDR